VGPKIALVRRGGRLPQASGYPAARRAPRALLRRRTPLRRHRADLLAHGQQTNRPSTLPESGKTIAYQANRAGGAERFADAAVPKPSAVALALRTSDAALRTDLALSSRTTAKHHDAPTLSLVPTVPGIGKSLSLGRLDAIHDLRRCPRVQACASSARLVQGSQASAGKRSGPSGPKRGQAHLTWAFAAAAVLFLRHNEPGQKRLARWETKPDQGKALRSLAPQLGRAVDSMLKRTGALDTDLLLQSSGSRAREPAA
jgi:hypothetical protein